MSLADLAIDLRKQEERAPNNQILFCVYDIELVAIGDTDRINDADWEYGWFDCDDCVLIERDDDMFDALDLVADGEVTVTINNRKYERLNLLHVPKLVSVFLTNQAANRFIHGGRHEFRKPYVKALTIDRRNVEMRDVRSLIANTF